MSTDRHSHARDTDIAIIGVSSLYPKANDTASFWQNLQDKVDGISMGSDEWALHYYDPEVPETTRIYTKMGGFIDREQYFDPLEFGIMPNTVESAFPDQFLALKHVKWALQDAGYWEGKEFDKKKTGVVLGYGPNANRANILALQHGQSLDAIHGILRDLLPDATPEEIWEIRQDLRDNLPPMVPEAVPGFVANILSGRIANRLDLMGPNYIVDAACTASFIALDNAIKELQSGRSDMMITGGVACSQPPQMFMVFSMIEALSHGDVRPFDKDAEGVLLGEGMGIFILKRLKDAERDGDKVYAVIKGMSLSSDGKSKGMLAPRFEGEMLALQRAYEESGVDPRTISLVEAHGTGIKLGDETEMKTIKTIFGERTEKDLPLGVGGVKSMIGHSLMAAGSAGLMKTALALYHKVLPPTLCDEVNPDLELEGTRIYINNETRPWIHGEDHPRRAGVNAFGFGGIDGHIVLEEYTGPTAAGNKVLDKHWPYELFVFRGQTAESVLTRVKDAIGVLEHASDPLVKDVAYSFAKAAEADTGDVRLAVLVTDKANAISRLQEAADKLRDGSLRQDRPKGGIFFGDKPVDGKVAFLYPGHGSQYPEMFSELTRRFPKFREWFDMMDKIYFPVMNIRPSELLFPPPTVWTDEMREANAREIFTSDASIALTTWPAMAMDQLVRETLGLKADVMLGHSTGELNALRASGVSIVPEGQEMGDAVKAIIESTFDYRKEMGEYPTGALMTVGAGDTDKIHEIVDTSKGKLKFVLDNCPNQVLVYGSKDAIDDAKSKFEAAGGICERMPFDRAFHTPDFKGFTKIVHKRFTEEYFAEGHTKLMSATKADYYSGEQKQARRYAADLWSEPVRFKQAVEKLYEDGVRVFVEVGPNATLSAFVNDTLFGKDDVLIVSSNNARRNDLEQLNTMLARLWVHGIDPRFEGMYEHRVVQELPVKPDEIEVPKRRPTDRVLALDPAELKLTDGFRNAWEATYEKIIKRRIEKLGLTAPQPAGSNGPTAQTAANGSHGSTPAQPEPQPAPAQPAETQQPAAEMPPQPQAPPQPDPNAGYPPPPVDPYGNPLPPVDAWGNPLPPQQPYGPPPVDMYGNPLPPVDAWGNPLPPMPYAPPPVDPYGNPLPPQPYGPPPVDAWGNPLPPAPYGPPPVDMYGNPLPPVDAWGNPLPPGPPQQPGPWDPHGQQPAPPSDPHRRWVQPPLTGGPEGAMDPYAAPWPPPADPYGMPTDPWAMAPPPPPWDPSVPAEVYPGAFDPNAAPPWDTMTVPPGPSPAETPVMEPPNDSVETAPSPLESATPAASAEPEAPAPAPLPDPVAPPAEESTRERADAVRAKMERNKSKPYGQREMVSSDDLIALFADDRHPPAPDHMIKRFDREAAKFQPFPERPTVDGIPFERAYPLLGRIVNRDDSSIECERHFDLDADPVLRSHTFGGPPSKRQKDAECMAVVPFVMSLEMCAEASVCIHDGTVFAKEFRMIRGHRWLALPEGELDVKIKAFRVKEMDDGDILVRAELYQWHKAPKETEPKPHLTFEAMVLLGRKELPELEPMPFNVPDVRHSHFTDEMLYNTGVFYTLNYTGRFHGRHFKGIRHIRHYSPHTIEVDIEPRHFDDYFRDIQDPVFQTNMQVMDAAILQVGLWYTDVFAMDTNVFPFLIKKLSVFGGPHQPGHKLIGRAVMFWTGVGDVDLPFKPYFKMLDRDDGIIREMDEEEEEGFHFPDNYYKPVLVPNLGCLEGAIDLLDADTGKVLMHAEGWQNRFFDVPMRYDKITLYPRTFTLSFPWLEDETGGPWLWRNEPFQAGLLEGSWGVWGSKLAHCVLTESEKKTYYSFPEGSTRREDWLMGRIAAKEALVRWITDHTMEERLAPIDIETVIDEHGKPSARCVVNDEIELPPLSIAHSNRWAVAAVSRNGGPVGVDYEFLDGFNYDEVLAGGFDAEDAARVNALPESDRQHATAALWCAKEAAAKALGRGMNHEPRNWRIAGFDLDAGSVDIAYNGHTLTAQVWFEGNEVVAVCELPPGDGDRARHDTESAADVVSAPAASSAGDAVDSSSASAEDRMATVAELPAVTTSFNWDDPNREPTELEEQLIEMWERLLDVDDVGLHDDFFELGGESVLAVRLIGMVEKLVGTTIPVAAFLKTRTVSQMAQILTDEDWSADWSSLVPVRPAGDVTPVFLAHPVGGNVLNYRELIARLPENQPIYAFQAKGLDGTEEPFDNIPDMAQHYLKAMRAAQETGPYLFAGFSGGGYITWEMTKQLEQMGEEVALLCMFDTYGPGYFTLKVEDLSYGHFIASSLWRLELFLQTLDTLPSRKEQWKWLVRKFKHGNWRNRSASGSVIRKVEEIMYHAVLDYQPPPIEKTLLTLFKATVQPRKSQTTGDPELNWGPLAGAGIDIHTIPGAHGHLVELPHVIKLADELSGVLDAVHARLAQRHAS